MARAKDPNDDLAWSDFFEYYSGFMQMLLWKMNIPKDLHEDLKQELLLKIWVAMKDFEFDHSKAKFRTWLATIIRNGTMTYMRSFRNKEKREKIHQEQEVSYSEEQMIPGEIEQLINKEWANYMVQHVIDHLKQFFSGKAIEVYLLSSKGLDGKEISRELNVPLNTVYVLRNRVKVRLMSEIKNLRATLEF